MKNNHFKFKKAYKIIKIKKFVKSYNIKNKFQGIEIYPYDEIFDTLDELIKKISQFLLENKLKNNLKIFEFIYFIKLFNKICLMRY